MCQKGARAERHVVVPTGRLWKARLGTNLGPSWAGRSGPCRGPESPTAGLPSVPPGRPHPGNAGKPGGVARRRLGCPARPRSDTPQFDAGLYKVLDV